MSDKTAKEISSASALMAARDDGEREGFIRGFIAGMDATCTDSLAWPRGLAELRRVMKDRLDRVDHHLRQAGHTDDIRKGS